MTQPLPTPKIQPPGPSRRSLAAASRIGAALLCAACVWTPMAQAQEEPTSLFIDRVDVNLINVEVFVTDRGGNRVNDLSIDDFEILEDGRPVEITNFYSTARANRAVSGFDRDREMVTSREVPATEVIPKEQQLSLAVYVDNFNIRADNRTRVLRDVGRFVEDRVRQGDRVALISHGLTVDPVVPFTDDLVALARGVEKISKETTYGQSLDAAKRRVRRTIVGNLGRRAAPGQEAGNARDEIRSYVQQVQSESRRTVNALEGVLRSMSGLPGRKALLYVSDGLEQRAGAELYEYYIDQFGASPTASFSPTAEILNSDQSDLFDAITQQANAGQVTLYTLHAMGSPMRRSVSAENTPASLSNRGTGMAEAIELDNVQEPLVEMAAATGGGTILNTSNFAGAFEELSKDFDSLYSLGYASRTGGDGRFHKIEVRMKDPNLKARHRNGYLDKAEEDRVADRTYSSLILNVESNPLNLTVDFGEPEKTGRNKFHLPLLVRIPFDGITMLPGADQHEGRLRIFLAVQDEEGGVSGLQEVPYPVRVPNGEVESTVGKEMGYAGKLLLRPGLAKVAIGVWDEVSGTESFVHKSVRVGKKGKKNKKKKNRS